MLKPRPFRFLAVVGAATLGLLAGFLSAGVPAMAGAERTLRVSVTDGPGGPPVPGASLELSRLDSWGKNPAVVATQTTDDAGLGVLTPPKTGNYILKTIHADFEPGEVRFKINSKTSQDHPISIVLKRKPGGAADKPAPPVPAVTAPSISTPPVVSKTEASSSVGITIEILQADNERPIPGASVRFAPKTGGQSGARWTASTDAAGQAVLTVPAVFLGTGFSLTITHPDFENKNKDIAAESADSAAGPRFYNVVLKPKTAPPAEEVERMLTIYVLGQDEQGKKSALRRARLMVQDRELWTDEQGRTEFPVKVKSGTPEIFDIKAEADGFESKTSRTAPLFESREREIVEIILLKASAITLILEALERSEGGATFTAIPSVRMRVADRTDREKTIVEATTGPDGKAIVLIKAGSPAPALAVEAVHPDYEKKWIDLPIDYLQAGSEPRVFAVFLTRKAGDA